MKSSQVHYLLIFVVFLGLSGCFDPPEFPNTPRIEFSRIEFVETDFSDSLTLTFYFEDGDGDIGLRSSETTPPFHSKEYILDSDFRFVTFRGDDFKTPFYAVNLFDGEPQLYSQEDDRPPYNCLNYQFDSLAVSYGDSTAIIEDTLYVVANEFNKNLYIEIYRKIRGEYININDEFPDDASCTETFSARFPIFDEQNLGEPLSGEISYSMISAGFGPIFRNDSIMVEFYIYDRALNKSNVVRSPDFVLADITRD
jgi:hypothetical protein